MKNIPIEKSAIDVAGMSCVATVSGAPQDQLFSEAYSMACRAIRVRTATSVSMGALPAIDAEDLEQEALLTCWQALAFFDPHRASLRTFIERVVAARLISLHRARARRPKYWPLEDLGAEVEDSRFRMDDLRLDVVRVLSALSDCDRRLALALAHHSPSEVARLFGIARSSVYARIAHLRPIFVAAGLAPARLGADRRGE